MADKYLIGMWRYALSKNLKKHIRDAQVKQMCLRIDPDSRREITKFLCGTTPLNQDCPFYVPPREKDNIGRCLAPANDKEWHNTMKEMKHSLNPIYELRDYMVVGCYLKIYCERGYQNYICMQSWKRRYKTWLKCQELRQK